MAKHRTDRRARRDFDDELGPSELYDGELVLGGRKQGRWVEQEGNRFVEVEYRDGVRDGRYRRWRRDRTLLEQGSYTAGERNGPFTIHTRDVRIDGSYRAGKLDGIYRVAKPDGTIELEREYRDGEIYRGPWDVCDDVRKDWVRARGNYDGHREGVWEEYGIPPHDAPDGSPGPLMVRATYLEGSRHGAYEERHYNSNEIAVGGQYERGQRVGRWRLR